MRHTCRSQADENLVGLADDADELTGFVSQYPDRHPMDGSLSPLGVDVRRYTPGASFGHEHVEGLLAQGYSYGVVVGEPAVAVDSIFYPIRDFHEGILR
jgi:hypothetical protein